MKRTSLPLQRREFITLLGGAAAAWPLAARAQQPSDAGASACSWLGSADDPNVRHVSRVPAGLAAARLDVEGRNVAIEYRWAASTTPSTSQRSRRNWSRSRRTSSWRSAAPQPLAADAGDPHRADRVRDRSPIRSAPASSRAWRGRAATSPAFIDFESSLAANGWSCSRSIAPSVTRVGGPRRSEQSRRHRPVRRNSSGGAHARGGGRPIDVPTQRDRARRRGIRDAVERRPDALIVDGEPFVITHRDRSSRSRPATRLPAVYSYREFVAGGGLISYGADLIGPVPARGRLRRPHPQGREAGRPAGAGADQVRAGRSTSRPPRRSASTCRRRCSPAPTR